MADGTYEPTVFFIRNQGFVRPTVARQISFADSLIFERLHEQVYRDLGFQLVEVPAGPLAERVALIQRTVGLTATPGTKAARQGHSRLVTQLEAHVAPTSSLHGASRKPPVSPSQAPSLRTMSKWFATPR